MKRLINFQSVRLVFGVVGLVLILTILNYAAHNQAEPGIIESPRTDVTYFGKMSMEKGCVWLSYNCNMYYYWKSPDDFYEHSHNMRFTPAENCTLNQVGLVLYDDYPEFSNISGQGIDVYVWDDDGFGFPNSALATLNVPGPDIVFDPDTLFVDFSTLNLTFSDDFHVGYRVVNEVSDNIAIVSDDGTCGTQRSSVWHAGSWATMHELGWEVNFCISAKLCAWAPDSVCCSIQVDPNLGFEPCETIDPFDKWPWPVPGAPPILDDYHHVLMTPIVADLENDGIPEVFFISYLDDGLGSGHSAGVLRVISGLDGSPVFSYPTDVSVISETFHAWSQLAVADIDNDGMIEIIGTRRGAGALITLGQGLFCLDVEDKNEDGDYTDPNEVWIKWQSLQPSQGIRFSGISIADINKDGIAEVIVGNVVLDGLTGGLFNWPTYDWREDRSGIDHGAGPNQMYLSFAADVVAGGDLEVVNGRTVYYSNGSVLWSLKSEIDSGYAGVFNFDGDPDGEVVVVARGKVHLVDYNSGSPADPDIRWTTILGVNENRGGPPCIGECYSGSAGPEIGVAGVYKYFVLKGTTGDILCSFETKDESSAITGSTMFDFDHDGTTELIYNDECTLWVYQAGYPDGSIIYKTPNSSRTVTENPIVADVDNNGHADIIVCANNESGASCVSHHGIRVFRDQLDCWVNTRKIWNQHAYSITNVNDDGTIPVNRPTNWLPNPDPPPPIFNNFRRQMYWHEDPTLQPDLCVHQLRPVLEPHCDGAGNAIITATVVNNGPVDVPPGVKVAFYHCPGGTPPDGCEPGYLLGVAETQTTLGLGDTEDVEFKEENCQHIMLVEACVDDDGFGNGKIAEYNEDDNCCCWWLQTFCCASIQGQKFEDLNLDGIYYPPDQALNLWWIGLFTYCVQSGDIVQVRPWQLTNTAGYYNFTLLKPPPEPLRYRVYEIYDPITWFQTAPNAGYHELDLQEREAVVGIDFGNAHRDSVDCYYELPMSLPTVTFCADQFVRGTSFTMINPGACNDYRWYLVPEPAGVPPCNSGGLKFTLAAGSLYFPFLSSPSITVQFDIDRNSTVPPLAPGDYACYKLVVVDQCTGVISCAYGEVTVSDAWCGKWDDCRGDAAYCVSITNTGTETMFRYEFTALLFDGSPDPYVSLNGLPPGTGVEDSLEIAPGDSAVISVGVEFTEPRPGEIHQLMLDFDVDVDGDLDQAMSRPLMSWTCGDADASGIVEISDAVFLINYIFVPGSPAPDPYESGDVDCSEVVEISDAVYIINYVFIPDSPPPCDPDGDGEPDC